MFVLYSWQNRNRDEGGWAISKKEKFKEDCFKQKIIEFENEEALLKFVSENESSFYDPEEFVEDLFEEFYSRINRCPFEVNEKVWVEDIGPGIIRDFFMVEKEKYATIEFETGSGGGRVSVQVFEISRFSYNQYGEIKALKIFKDSDGFLKARVLFKKYPQVFVLYWHEIPQGSFTNNTIIYDNRINCSFKELVNLHQEEFKKGNKK